MQYPIFLNPFHNPSDTIIVAGSGRSGTTWLGNIIGSGPGFLSLFEPFDYRQVPDIDTGSLRLYIPPHEPAHPLDQIIAKVLRGKVRNEWILAQNTRKFTWRILIKDIRANLFLGYLKNRFQSPLVFIMRHPCATVLSRLERNWDTHLDDFLQQEDLMNDYLAPFETLLKAAKSAPERHALMWSVENYVPLQQLARDQYIFCTYEELVANTETEINRIFTVLGLKRYDRLTQIISKPTSVSKKKKADLSSQNLLEGWKQKLSTAEIRAILDITHAFGLDLYNDKARPVSKLNVMEM